MAQPELPAPRLEFIFAAHVTVDAPLDLGDVGKGRRRIVPIMGGEFSGPAMRGKVLDVAVDVRVGSPTFGRHVSVELSDENRRQLWVPRGFAHGFAVLSETADFFYKCDELYNPEQELVVAWNDPALGISWGIDAPTLSARDAAGRRLADITNLPKYGSI